MKKQIQHIILIFLLVGVTFSFAMFQGGFVSWFIFFVILPFVFYSFLLMIVPIKIEYVRRELSAYRAERGRDIHVTVHFKIKSPIPLLFLTAREITRYGQSSFHMKNSQSSQLFFVGLNREFSWSYTLEELPRGEHQLIGLHFTVVDFFGWVTKIFSEELYQTIIVYPQMTEITNTTLNMQYEQGAVVAKYRAIKDTALVSGLRDYQPGDRFSAVHWKSFARTGDLRTKEFEDRQSQNITVCLDRFSKENFEAAVDLTASIVKSAVRNRNDIAFISGGDRRIFYPTVQTEVQLEQVLHHLATVEENGLLATESFTGKERLLSQSVLMVISGEMTPSIQQLLMKANIARQIICIIIAPTENLGKVKLASNCKLIAVEREQFAKVFSEVSKR